MPGEVSRFQPIRHIAQVTVASNKGNPAKDLLVEAGFSPISMETTATNIGNEWQ